MSASPVLLALAWCAALAGLAPLLAVAATEHRGDARDAGWWWLGVAFAVSSAADVFARATAPPLMSALYPLTQAAIVAAVLLSRADAWAAIGVMVVAGLFEFLVPDFPVNTMALRVLAWGGICWTALSRWELGRLRTALVCYFGGSLVTWGIYVVAPGLPSWLLYQATRLLGIALFCWAVRKDRPALRIARGMRS